MASAENLASRYRPTTFTDVVGAKGALTVLQASAATATPINALLLSGGSGVGKTTLARIYAAAFFCPHVTDGNPCGQCDVCASITTSRTHPDVTEVDAAAAGGVDNVRTFAAAVSLVPAAGNWRIHIIDEAHGLTKEGASAFLRLLEEPPAHAVFILATTDPQKLPAAIRGRCLHLPVSVADDDAKLANLRRICRGQQWTFDDSELATIIDITDPDLGVRGTISNLSAVAGAGPGANTYTIVSAVPPHILVGLCDAIVDRRTVDAAATIEDLTGHYPALTLHTQLVAYTRRKLHHCLRSGSTYHQDALTWLHLWTAFTTNPPTSAGLLLAVTRASRPELHSMDGLVDLTSEADAIAARLDELIEKVGKLPPQAVATATDPTGERPPHTPGTPVDAVTDEPDPTVDTPDTGEHEHQRRVPDDDEQSDDESATSGITFVRGNDRIERLLDDPARAQRVAAIGEKMAEADQTHTSAEPASFEAAQTVEPIPEEVDTTPDTRITVDVAVLNAVAKKTPRAAMLVRNNIVTSNGTTWTLWLRDDTDVGLAAVAAAHLHDEGHPTTYRIGTPPA